MRWTRWRIPVLLLALVGCLSGTDEPASGDEALSPRFPPRPLPAESPDGALLLEKAERSKPLVADYLGEHGPPDRVMWRGQTGLHFLYLDDDRLVSFRARPGAPAPRSRRIPPRLLRLLTPADRERVLKARQSVPPGSHLEANMVLGSCFAVSPDGLLLTADHASGAASSLEIRLADGTSQAAELVARLPESDLALLRVDHQDLTYLPLTDAVWLGEPVFTIGFPAVGVLGIDPKFAEGAVSGLHAGPGHEQLLLTSVPVLPGNSGGPLVNARGEAVGVVVGNADARRFFQLTGQRPESISYAIRASEARQLFDRPAALDPAASWREAVERARAASCLVTATGVTEVRGRATEPAQQ